MVRRGLLCQLRLQQQLCDTGQSQNRAFCLDLLRVSLDSCCLFLSKDLLPILRSRKSDQAVDRDNICRDLLDQRLCCLVLFLCIDGFKPFVCSFLCLRTAGWRVDKCLTFRSFPYFAHDLFLRSFSFMSLFLPLIRLFPEGIFSGFPLAKTVLLPFYRMYFRKSQSDFSTVFRPFVDTEIFLSKYTRQSNFPLTSPPCCRPAADVHASYFLGSQARRGYAAPALLISRTTFRLCRRDGSIWIRRSVIILVPYSLRFQTVSPSVSPSAFSSIL